MAMAVAGSVITFQLLAGISSSSSRAPGASAVGVESFVGLRGSSTTTSVAAAARLCFLGSDSARQLRASRNPVSVAGITEQFTSVSSRHLAWVVQKSKKKTGAVSSSSRVVVTAAAAVAEEAAVPAVTTQAVQRPTKIGKGIVRLRLTRLGRKKRPFYRIVATHSSWRRDGKYIELLGHYNPLHAKDDMGIVVKADRIKYWLGVGAQPSDTVTGILHKVGILKKPELEQ